MLTVAVAAEAVAVNNNSTNVTNLDLLAAWIERDYKLQYRWRF